MLASEIIKRARSLSDTPNSQFISYDDELESLWESYKDIYSKITDSSDDYYISKAIIDTSTAVQIGQNEWELSLPAGIYKLRFVDYQSSGSWINMERFNTSQRNTGASQPKYRWRGDKLWLIGGTGLPSQIRVDYYPSPVKPTLPEMDYQYALSYPTIDAQKISSPNYFSVRNANLSSDTDYLIYIYNGVNIRIESAVLNKTSTLYTSTGLSSVYYNLGYIYFLKGGDIWRASTDFTSTITPTNITSTGVVTSFTVTKGKIYFSTATETAQCNLDGTSPVVILVYPTECYSFVGSSVYYIKDDGLLYLDGVSTGISAMQCSSDGTYLYYLDSAGVLHKYLPTKDYILKTNVGYMGQPADEFIAIINDNAEISAISTKEDTDFDYPLNEANEIMAYQSAIDYKRKQKGDTVELSGRLATLWDRFFSVLKRDEGQPERRVSEVPYSWNY